MKGREAKQGWWDREEGNLVEETQSEMNKRNSVISFKNKDKITAIALFKEEKNMLPLEWRYTFFSSKISKSIYILFLSCLFIIVDHNQPDQKQFQYSFCSQNWHQVFIWRNGWNWIDCPRTPSFFPKMVLNHSQWNLAHMELYLFSVSCKKRKMCFFFLNGLSFCIWLSPLDTFQ